MSHWNHSKLTHFNGCILTRITRWIPVEMCQFSRVPNVSLKRDEFLLRKFSQRTQPLSSDWFVPIRQNQQKKNQPKKIWQNLPRETAASKWGPIKGPSIKALNTRECSLWCRGVWRVVKPPLIAERHCNCSDSYTVYTQRNLFQILLDQPEIRLYLPYSDWFGTANGHCLFAVPNQSETSKYNLIWFGFNKIS